MTKAISWGDYGVLDQQAVLKWVQRNIAKFGGDKNNVTLGGQSAGAVDTGFNMVSPLAKGLFQRALCESYCPIFPCRLRPPARRSASASRLRRAAARARALPPPSACVT